MPDTKLDQQCIDTIRMLALDQVQTANAGHPGMPLGASPALYAIWDRFLKHNPANPRWCDRDRFVLSAGHACSMLYAVLHLYGYNLPLDELKRFRRLGSITPGHPEFGLTPGVEATTGPLGQGIANAVGMAIAEAHLAAYFNRPGHEVVSHHTFVLCSDGDLMEGVTAEACSLAGFLGLGKLIAVYDDNGISIEGETRVLAYDEDTAARFTAYGWHVIEVADGNDLAALEAAIREGMNETAKPTLVRMRTRIGYKSPAEGDAACHGAPFKPEEALATKKAYGWPEEPAFYIPDNALARFREAGEAGPRLETAWRTRFDAYRQEHPDLAARFAMAMKGRLPDGWQQAVPVFKGGGEAATRNAGGDVMNALAEHFDGYLVGGSADLSPSTKTIMNDLDHIRPGNFAGSNMHFGVREHAMGAILNGMAYHGGLIPFGATFMVFSDYCRPAIRVAALSHLPVIYVFTHDSIGVGEDGPTHQPVEQIAALRAIPNLTVIRPADANETAEAWKIALLRRNGPTVLALTRQKLPILARDKYPVADVAKGAYVLAEAEGGAPDVLLIASGSEVCQILEAQRALAADGIRARVVSMPSWEIFEDQDQAYKDHVLPPAVTARLAVEAGVGMGWERYTGDKGAVICMTTFGASGAYKDVLKHFGFTVEKIVAAAKSLAAR